MSFCVVFNNINSHIYKEYMFICSFMNIYIYIKIPKRIYIVSLSFFLFFFLFHLNICIQELS